MVNKKPPGAERKYSVQLSGGKTGGYLVFDKVEISVSTVTLGFTHCQRQNSTRRSSFLEYAVLDTEIVVRIKCGFLDKSEFGFAAPLPGTTYALAAVRPERLRSCALHSIWLGDDESDGVESGMTSVN